MGLAGPKNKQRISADPNNLHWSNDTGKFGHKMLTKMGWAPGKGLGANEDGNTEHVKVRLKDNNFGIGANKKNMDNWLDNTDAFSRLLADLNDRVSSEQSSPAADSLTSKEEDTDSSNSDVAESTSKKKSKKGKKDKKDKKAKKEKSKKSKSLKKDESDDEEKGDTVAVATTTATLRNAARAKFLRAKRLANGKDMESMSQILGIKSNSASAATTPVSSPSVSEESVQVIESTTSVPMTVNKMNVQDYFAFKMKNVKVSGIASSGLKTSVRDEEEEEVRPFGGLGFRESNDSSPSPGFGLGSRSNGLVTGNGLGFVKSTTEEMTAEIREDANVEEPKKKSRKRKSEVVEDSKSEKRKSRKEKKEKKSSDEEKKESKVEKKKEKQDKKDKKEKKEKKSKKDSK
ncbi:hypothetical protein BGW37DRAFT_170296 [Umbelopsis sp. PMI_123]|nr:hypothetical protein BGW37DRAFT_170296 [Umbelopsis sp. PMI_123]